MSKKLSFLALVALTLFAAACDNSEKKRCDSKADCGEGQTCDLEEHVCKNEGSASTDVCKDVDCSGGGVCSTSGSSAGKCVNKEICEAKSDCLSDYFCVDGSCKSKDDVCQKCTRGVCNEKDPTKACVDAKSCTVDKQCLEGNYCAKAKGASTGTCQINYCELGSGCARGICVPAAGASECKNKETCEFNKDCLDGHVCDPTDHTCKVLDDTLAKVTCTGRMAYKAKEPVDSEAGFVCEEPATCANALDCFPGKVCDHTSTTCTAVADTCVDKDAGMYEDAADSTETAMPGAPSAFSKVDGTICPSDVDKFTYEAAASAEDKKLLVELRIDPFDVGVGNLVLTINGTAATVVEPTLLRAEINVPANPTDKTEFKIEVSADDQMRATIPYTLTARVLGKESINSCKNAEELLPNTKTSGDIAPDEGKELKSACLTGSEEFPDKLYKFTLTEKSYVTITAKKNYAPGEPAPNVTLTLRRDCLSDENELACARITSVDPTIEETLDPGTYFLLVQGESTTELARFLVNMTVEEHLCEPGTITCTGSLTSGQYQLCNRYGTARSGGNCGLTKGTSGAPIRCAEDDVAGDHCESKPLGYGDSCTSPIRADVLPFHHTGTIDGMTNAVNPYNNNPGGASSSQNQCPKSPGKDIVAVVNAKAGETIHAKFAADYDTSLYIVKGPEAGESACSDVTGKGCLEGVNKFHRPKAEEIFFEVGEGKEGDYYIIADAIAENASGTYTLDIDIQRQTCTPDEKRCVGNNLEICDGTGKYVVSRTCGGTCNSTTLVCDAEPSTTCDHAKPVTFDASGNATVVGYIEDYTSNDYDGTATSCAQKVGPGVDATYTFTPEVGDFYQVELTADFDANLLFTTDCGDINATCIAGAHLEGVYRDGSGVFVKRKDDAHETISFIAQTADPIKMIVDSDDAAMTSGTFKIDIKKAPKLCEAGATKCKTGVSNVLEVCSPEGTKWVEQDCRTSSGSGECVGTTTPASCVGKEDEVCGTAPALTLGTTSGSISKRVGMFNPGVGARGLCYFAAKDEPVGGEKFYKVTIPAGEVLEVKVNPGGIDDSFLAYLLNGCGIDSCVKAIKATANGVLRYVNNDTKPFEGTLVIDRNSKDLGSTAARFTIETRLYTKECDRPDAPYACDDSTPSKLKYCKEDLTSELIDCQFGCEKDGVSVPRCKLPPNDKCSDPDIIVMDGTNTVEADLKDYTPQVNWTVGSTPSCDQRFDSAQGREAIYKLEKKNKGKIVVATLTKKFTEATQMRLYASVGCGGTVTECTERAVSIDSGSGTLKFIMPDEDLYLYADTTTDVLRDNENYPFTLEVTFQDTQCDPGTRKCVDKDGKRQLKVCDKYGENAPLYLECAEGCSSTEDDAICDAGNNDGRTCGAAHYFDTSTGELVFFFDNHRGVGKLGEGDCSSLPELSDDTAYFVFDGSPLDYVNIEVTPIGFYGQPAPDVLVAPVSLDCGTSENRACREEFVNTGGLGATETLRKRLGNDRRFYFAVAGVKGRSSGAFKVSVTSDPGSCTDGESVCDGDRAKTCVSGSWVYSQCHPNGCVKPASGPAMCTADTCDTAIEITGSKSGTVFSRVNPYPGYKNAHPQCLGYQVPGHEHYFHVKGQAGDSIKLIAETQDALDPALYVTSANKCASPLAQNDTDMVLHCEKGKDDWPTAAKEVIEYTLKDDGTGKGIGEAYFVIDAYAKGAGSINYEFIFPACRAGEMGENGCQTDAAGSFIEVCNGARTGLERVDCPMGCNAGGTACEVPQNDTCMNPIEVGPTGGVYEGNLVSATNYLSSTPIASGGCGMSKGNDAFYVVKGNAGTEVNIWLQGLAGPVTLYTLSSCDGKGGENSSCRDKAAAESANNNNAMSLRGLTIPDSGSGTGELYIVVDQPASAVGNSPYVLYVNVGGDTSGSGSGSGGSTTLCTPNKASCVGGNHYQLCSADGKKYEVEYDCANNDCTADGCSDALNNTCGNAYPAVSGASFKIQRIDNYRASMPDCGLGISGYDAVYSFSLQPNEGITIDIESKFRGGALIMSSSECSKATPACLVKETLIGTPKLPAKESLTYVSQETAEAEFYLVIKSESATGDLPEGATISFKKSPGCVPGTRCVDGELITCEADGVTKNKVFCPSGCDMSSNVCLAPTNSTCKGAAVLLDGKDTGNQVVKGALSTFQPFYMDKFDTSTCGDAIKSYGEHVAFYAVDLKQGDVLNYSVEADKDTNVYFFRRKSDAYGCDKSAGAGVCEFYKELRSGAFQNDGSFQAVESGRYYFAVVDVLYWNRPDRPSFTLSVEKNPVASCVPDQPISCTGDELKTCTSSGKSYFVTHCSDGCSTTEVACVESGKSCGEAITLGDQQAASKAYKKGVDRFSPNPGTYNQCTVSKTPEDEDTYYRVYLQDGQKLTAALGNMSSGNNGPMLFLLGDGCTENSCLKNDARVGTDAVNYIEYTADRDGYVYLVVDSNSTYKILDTDEYMLQVFIN